MSGHLLILGRVEITLPARAVGPPKKLDNGRIGYKTAFLVNGFTRYFRAQPFFAFLLVKNVFNDIFVAL